MDPDNIELETITRLFSYEKQCREIDECRDIDELKSMLKTSIKLYLKQQEVVSKLPGLWNINT